MLTASAAARSELVDFIASAPSTPSFRMRVAGPILRFAWKALGEYRARRAINELQRLDDRMLRDIGLDRGSIEYAVRMHPERSPVGVAWGLGGARDARFPPCQGCAVCRR